MILLAAMTALGPAPLPAPPTPPPTESNVVEAWTGDLRSTVDLDGSLIPVEVSDTGCIATSFPDFFGKLREVVR